MNTPGNILRTERKKQKISLKDIASTFNINVEYLSLIEEDNYSSFPAEVFTKAYLRAYADALGLDSTYVLQLYTEQNVPVQSDSSQPVKRNLSFSYRQFILIAIALLITVSAFMFSGNEEKPVLTVPPPSINAFEPMEKKKIEEEKTPPLSVEPVRKKKMEEAKASPSSVAPVEKKKMEEAKASPSSVAPVGKKKMEEAKASPSSVEIAARDITWVSVKINGGRPREWLLRAGNTLKLSGAEKFVIKIGNAGATRVLFNGKDIGKLGPHGQVVDLVLP